MAASTQQLAGSPRGTHPHDAEKGTAPENAWTDFGVVPSILLSPPPHFSTIEFLGGIKVRPGKEISPQHAAHIPHHVDWPHDSKDLFTVILFDPDAPSRKNPVNAPWVPGNDINRGDTFYEYAGTGLHRYIWLVYRQENGNWKLPHVDSPPRAHWNWKSWLNTVSGSGSGVGVGREAYRLVSGNFWVSQHQG